MKLLAPGVWQLGGSIPPDAINVYLLDDVLIDAGTRFDGRRILKELRGRRVSAHALTHAHPDHQGASKQVCDALDIPLWCHADDADAMENGTVMASQPSHPVNWLIGKLWCGPAHPVARRLAEGDEVAGFEVLHVPGHSPGHVAYWRASDRVLLCGDVLNNMDVLTQVRGLHEPKAIFTPDPEANRESARRLAALEPALVLFGHGPPLRDPAALRRFVDAL